MSKLDKEIDNLYEKAWSVINGYPAQLGLLLVAGEVQKEYEKIRQPSEPQMTAKEIADLALENVRRQLENE